MRKTFPYSEVLPPEAKDTKFANKPITTEEEAEGGESIHAEHQPPVNQVDSFLVVVVRCQHLKSSDNKK